MASGGAEEAITGGQLNCVTIDEPEFGYKMALVGRKWRGRGHQLPASQPACKEDAN